jgi:CheY-like chemotaxis protein
MVGEKRRVLDVGNCDPDHGMIRAMLEGNFNVEVDRVMFVDEAIAAMKQRRYDLVLVNRLIFADGSPGIELHRRAKADPAIADVPIMMVSNYAEAQAESVAAGGLRGFGKARVDDSATLRLLGQVLPPAAAKPTSVDRHK